MTRFFYTILALLLFWSAFAQADVYKYVDSNGNVTFTNTPVKGAKRIFIEPAHTSPRSAPSNSARTQKSPHDFPRISAGAQRNRDINRKRILEDELASELKLLSKAQQTLSQSSTDGTSSSKLSSLRDNVLLHQKNISALKSEIAKIQ